MSDDTVTLQELEAYAQRAQVDLDQVTDAVATAFRGWCSAVLAEAPDAVTEQVRRQVMAQRKHAESIGRDGVQALKVAAQGLSHTVGDSALEQLSVDALLSAKSAYRDRGEADPLWKTTNEAGLRISRAVGMLMRANGFSWEGWSVERQGASVLAAELGPATSGALSRLDDAYGDWFDARRVHADAEDRLRKARVADMWD